MNDLLKYIEENRKNNGKPLDKKGSFLIVYDTLLSEYRGTNVSLVEVGVNKGGSLQLWKNYLGAEASIYGIDIHKSVLDEPQIKEFVADQGNRESLQDVAKLIPKIDIIIDDGSHKMAHQINTFEELFPYVSKGGLYVCEDLHTSYRATHGGGYKKQGTFIEYCKDLIDAQYHREDVRIPTSNVSKMIYSMSFYLYMVVIRKI